MDDPPRLNSSQYRRVKKLIRRLCANCDGGNCLLLDDGYEPCVCPQFLTCSLICKYFRAAVLPDDPELCGEIANAGDKKKCAACGQLFLPRSNRALYCDRCAPVMARRRVRERVRRYRGIR